MPAALPFALAYAASNTLAAAGASVAAQATFAASAAAFATTVQGVALTAAASYALNKLLAPGRQAPPSGNKSEYRQPLPDPVMHYGTVQVAGPLAFLDTNLDDAFDYSQFKIELISARRISAYRTLVLGGVEVTVDPDDKRVDNGLFNTSGEGLARISVHLGEDDQVADPFLLSYYEDSGVWTADHRLRGNAYAMIQYFGVTLENFNDVWGGQLPEFTPVIDSSLIYDPRLDTTTGGSGTHRADDPDTWEFSDNAGLCALDWLLYENGYNFPVALFNLASWRAFADLCDEDVDLKAGGTEKRYRVAMTVNLSSDQKKTVLARILAACDGQIYFDRDGLLCIRGGKWEAPTVTLVAERDAIQASFLNGPGALARFNELVLKFLSPELGYVESEGEAWQDSALITAEGGTIISREADFTQVPSFSQARRLAKIAMAKGNPKWRGAARTNLAGITAIGESAITLEWDELDAGSGDFNGVFWCEPGMALAEEGTGVSIPLSSADRPPMTGIPTSTRAIRRSRRRHCRSTTPTMPERACGMTPPPTFSGTRPDGSLTRLRPERVP
jgi:hypothetical protein